MQGDDLRTNEVVTRRNVLGDLDVHHTAARVEVLDAPVVLRPGRAVGRPGVLEDLEPGGIRALGRGGVVDGGHVDDDGAVVRSADGLVAAGAVTWLLVHFDWLVMQVST